MLSESQFEEIYIACGYTDPRYGIDGLATTVKEKFRYQSSYLGRRWLPAAVQTPGSRYIQMAEKRR